MSRLFIRPALLLAVLLFNALAVSAQSNNQSELIRLVNGLQAKYDKVSTLAADFTQVYNEPGKQERRESGRMLLKKPGRMRWDYTSPEEKLFICDGKWLYEYVSADNFATRSSMKEAGDMRAPFAFLLGRGNLRRDFQRIEFAAESPIKAGNKVIRLVPKRELDFKELLVEIEPNSTQISRLSVINTNDARSDFIFSNARENVPAPAAEFIFKAPAGVEVRDN
jgi:outer membrane lipoprotein carrier protein